ncbi:hypothetical protein Glove_208g174 [Diversispora epigaea]|uniref:G-protein coupled receptors family 1 profile domain-containing protein n=1 Tax=Diversispora epigaea TaxID=1348612 RepID=A0A397ILN5_9GLOM|nr:hypothetical protein Glove_208g174 [Diversispora epigaea]
MYTPLMIFLYTVCTISLICSLYVTYKLTISKKNTIVGVLAFSTSLVAIDLLASIIFKNELEKAPYGFCFAQGILLQYACYLTMACGLCFAIQTYRLLVLYKQTTDPVLQNGFYLFIFVYPVIITIFLGIISYKNDAIKPRMLNCDVLDPIWVRLVGYSGTNFILSIPGTIISGCSAYAVFKHLDQFTTVSTTASSIEELNSSNYQVEDEESGNLSKEPKEPKEPSSTVHKPTKIVIRTSIATEIENSGQSPSSNYAVDISSTTHDNPINPTNSTNPTNPTNPINSTFQNGSRNKKFSNRKSYGLTRRAAIRMAGFSLGFAFINLMGCVKTVLNVISGQPQETSISSNDWIGVFLGIIIYLVFGLPDKIFAKF